jgi:hypothetical protein
MICRCTIESPLAGWVVIRCYDDGAVEYGLCPECGGTLVAHLLRRHAGTT